MVSNFNVCIRLCLKDFFCLLSELEVEEQEFKFLMSLLHADTNDTFKAIASITRASDEDDRGN